MDASRVKEIVAPFVQINSHLRKLNFSAPEILAGDDANGFLLLEDFGDETFSRLLDKNFDTERLFALATDVLIALHKRPDAIWNAATCRRFESADMSAQSGPGNSPKDLRIYSPEKMFNDLELYLDVHNISEAGRGEFRKIWLDVLPLAHQVPQSLLLRDYHVANLMWLPKREGIRRAGLLDFQDAYAGPVTYDLISLLEDARRDLPSGLKEKMVARYLAQFSNLDLAQFEISWAILAALRHMRVLAIFEKLAREGKPDYKKFHSPRVEHLLQEALRHPKLAALKNWFTNYAR